MWRPHENRVSKTRFTTLINTEPITYQRKPREEKKKKKKKNQKNAEQRNLGSARPGWRVAWVFFTQVRATQVARDLGLGCA